MSKILYICYRKAAPSNVQQRIAKSCDRINADNISANPSQTFQQDNVAYGISNPLGTIDVISKNVLFGKLFQEEEPWKAIGVDYPDGNYAIFRADEHSFEVVTDELSTRTIWYYQDEEKFIASTSQRALIHFLGSFEFNESVIPWVLSSGSLGPENAWDTRISRLQPGSLLLDFKNWELTIKNKDFNFNVSNASDESLEQSLTASITSAFNGLEFDYSKWSLAFSGGHDCRGILVMLDRTKKPGQKVNTVTWGIEDAQKESGTDAQVAEEVAREFKTDHTYYPIDQSQEQFAVIVERFLKNGEGRIDHFSGYTDGFQIWKTLFENNVEGVIRGNQVFGQKEPQSALAVRSFVGIPLCTDFKNLQQFTYIRSLEQDIPLALKQGAGESLSTWRDRLLQEYRLPVIQAALSDLKFPYVDQFEPLLSKRIIEEVRQLPDHLRNEKGLFRKIVKSLNPNMKYATKSATINKKELLAEPYFLNLFREELSSVNAKSIFPENFLKEVIEKFNSKEEEQKKSFSMTSLKKLLASNLPVKWKKKIYGTVVAPSLDLNTFAFRVFIICRMNRIFMEDAQGKG